MANSIKTYVWNSSTHSNTSDFIAPTPLSGRGSTDIKVKVGSTILTSGYTLTVDSSNVAKVRFQTLPNNGDPIRIYRQTNHTGRLVDFVDGSLLTSETLDLDSNQLFNIAQEAYDKGDEATIGSESFYYSQGDAPENVAVGTLWYDTSSSTNILQVWSGTEWQATAPARITNKYGTTTAGGKTAVVSHPTNSSFSQFTDAAFTSDSSLYLNGVKLVETTSIYTIPTQGDYTVDNGTVTFLDLSSASDILVSETFSGHFSSSVFDSETNAAASADAAEASASTAGQWAGEAINNYSASNDEKLDAAKYASHPKGSSFSTHDNSATGQYSAKHYAETAADSATTASSAAANTQVQTVGTDLALGSNSKIKKVADDIDAVGDVSGIIDDVTSVSNLGNELDTIVNKYDGTTNASGNNKNIVQIDTVADNIGDVNTVAADTSKIDTIATDLGNGASSFIKKVSDGMASVTTVAGYVGTALANGITWLSSTTNQNTLGAVEAKIAEIDAVEAKLTQIDAVAGVADEVAVVGESGYKGNVQTVANTDYKAKVTTVASMQDDVNTVASASSDIDTITTGDNLTSVVAVATDLNGSNNIGTVAGIPTQVETVAGIAAEVVTVHGNNADISTVATSLNAGNSIDNVSGGITNVETVAGVISEVQTVAGISSDVTNLSASTGNMATLVSKLDQTTDLAGAVTDAQNSATSASSSASTATAQATAAAGSATTAATHAANLGSVAYQDLTAIAESKAVTAVDVFVYDTSKDSDGGAWRNRTQGTSWYNESLNTSTRGATKKFPAVAVIVAYNGSGNGGGVDIYDATDPDCPLWMRFQGDYSYSGGKMLALAGRTGNAEITSVIMKDAKLLVASNDQSATASGIHEIDFIKERCKLRTANNSSYNVLTNHVNIAARNADAGITSSSNTHTGLTSPNVNDVAVTVLPNAPIDPDTGLPVPTIAVATEGGVSVIKDDGSVANLTRSGGQRHVGFVGEHLTATRSQTVDVFNKVSDLPSGTYGDWTVRLKYFDAGQVPSINRVNSSVNDLTVGDSLAVASHIALSSLALNHEDYSKSMVNYITSSYNTGWMNGDIKLATLMDTTAETISNANIISQGTLYTTGRLGSHTYVNGASSLSITSNSDTNDLAGYVMVDLNCNVGETYTVTIQADGLTGTDVITRLLQPSNSNPDNNFPNQNTTLSRSITFKCSSSDDRLVLYGAEDQTPIGYTISLHKQVQDRSVNANGLNIVGNVTKSAVATGAELVGYEGGSGTYLEQPYNADLNFGYGDYCVMFWGKQISGDLTAVFRGDANAGATGGAGAMHIWLNGSQLKTIIDGATQQIATPKGNGSFAHYVVTRSNGTVYFYQDGVLFHTYNATTRNVSRTEGTKVLSGYYPHNNTANKLALLRISATAPTAEQIAKIYRDEKPLFQEGAKCTLYGDYDAVNALAYDEDTGILHAGTTGGSDSLRGRSDFKGLQRVDNTTYGVSTALSAANGLVVEE